MQENIAADLPVHELCAATFKENSFTFGSFCHGRGKDRSLIKQNGRKNLI